jgi:putative ABC transport system permease protein
MSAHRPPKSMSVLRTQLSGVLRRPARLLLTGLAVLVASFVVYSTVLAQQIVERTVLAGVTGTPDAADLVVTGDRGPIPAALLAKVRAVPGVVEAVGRTSYGVGIGNDYLELAADPGTGPLAAARITAGTYPAGPGEIAVTRRTADRLGLPIGTTTSVTVGEKNTKADLRVVGIVDAGDDYGQTAYLTLDRLSALDPAVTPGRIDVRVAGAGQAAAVATSIDALLGPPGDQRPQVVPAATIRDQEAKAAVSGIEELFIIVGIFVAIAVIAAALVATSTFRIVFAQRMRQLALLRAIGAGRGKLARALAVEGALVGLVTSTVGVLVALALGHLLPPVLRMAGIEVQNPGLPIVGAVAVIAGAVVVTIGAVLAPAFSAAKVAPLEALRSSSTTAGKTGIGRVRLAAGVLLAAAAGLVAGHVVANLPGTDTSEYDVTMPLLEIVGSGALAFLALIALGPVLVPPVLRLVGLPLRALGPTGRLAVGGIGGAPRRAAAISVVVALGVTMIAGVLVGSASLRARAEGKLAVSAPTDFAVFAAEDGKALPAALLEKARSRPELTHVIPYREVRTTLTGSNFTFTATDISLASVPGLLPKMTVMSGALDQVGPGTVAVSNWYSVTAGVAVGDPVTLTAEKNTAPVRVIAVLPGSGPMDADIMADPTDLDRLGAPAAATALLADAARTGEVGRTAGQKALKLLAGDQAGVTVLADQRDDVAEENNALLAVALGLVGLTVIIAVVGVGTTTALSVVERVRESGLLRAVGLSRGGLRTMLTAEAGLYGVIGATMGLLLGIPYAWLGLTALGRNVSLQLPVTELLVVFVALTLLTALAGVLPARKAARTSPVTALATDG